jgi:protein tyrosine/serine phosphatase
MFTLWAHHPNAYVLLHCTHGFNRTGEECEKVRA